MMGCSKRKLSREFMITSITVITPITRAKQNWPRSKQNSGHFAEHAVKTVCSHNSACYLRVLQLSRKTFYASTCYGRSPTQPFLTKEKVLLQKDGCFTQHKFYTWNRALSLHLSSRRIFAGVPRESFAQFARHALYRAHVNLRASQRDGRVAEIELTCKLMSHLPSCS